MSSVVLLVFAMAKYIKKVFVVLLGLGMFLAAPIALAATVTQGYNSSTIFANGTVVSLKDNLLTPTTNLDANSIVGVVVPADQYLINIDATKTTQVISSGQAVTFVSDINGEIKSGDKLTASPIEGVAMKATESGKILGVAREDLNAKTTTKSTNVKDRYGQSKKVNIGLIDVDINIVDYQISASGTSAVVAGLQSIASSATGKQVTPIRAVLAALVLILALVLSVIVLYSSVSSSIRSIGRNPLSKRFVVQGLIQVIIAVFIIMIAAFSVVYIIIGS